MKNKLIVNRRHAARRVAIYQLSKGVTYARRWQSPGVAALLACCLLSAALLATFLHSNPAISPGLSPASNHSQSVAAARSLSKARSYIAAPTTQPSQPKQNKPVQETVTLASLPAAWTKLPLYAEPNNTASSHAASMAEGAERSTFSRLGSMPISHWFGDWDTDPQVSSTTYVNAAAQAHSVPVLTLYNIPYRDCGSYSAGGSTDGEAYLSWIRAISRGIGNNTAVVILEPDALASIDCLPASGQSARYQLLSQAVSTLKSHPNTYVYIDAGNPAWQPVGTTVKRLLNANIAQADGFSLNVANYTATSRNQSYGDQISNQIDGKHYVIDISRNGNSNLVPDAWCNNFDAALGGSPTTVTNNPRNDALLWIKIPWESDGSCNGGPRAGDSYWDFALRMAHNANW